MGLVEAGIGAADTREAGGDRRARRRTSDRGLGGDIRQGVGGRPGGGGLVLGGGAGEGIGALVLAAGAPAQHAAQAQYQEDGHDAEEDQIEKLKAAAHRSPDEFRAINSPGSLATAAWPDRVAWLR